MAEKKDKKLIKAKKTRKVTTSGNGRVYVNTTFNNTIVTVTNEKGDTISWSSSGNVGFKGTRKSTPFAATQAVDEALKKGKEVGLHTVEVYIKGPGVGRDSSLRAVRASGLSISMIADITPIPHNGPRMKKRRRV
ncbi:MAG: 30S ribosomal protein S11 [Candidatus Levybacteria bacterium]|nr:30S ribosomal protein S11 [Candidatus Levybacteria bacterium]